MKRQPNPSPPARGSLPKRRATLEPVPGGLGSSTARRLAESADSLGSPTPQLHDAGADPSASDRRDAPHFPGYTVLGRVGAGSFGTILRVRDEALEREVALKILAAGPRLTAREKDSFLHEARALARVRHPNVLGVHAVLENEGKIAIVTEFIDGQTLEDIVEERGLFGASEAAQVGIEVCKALAAVHAAGIVHRDVKPANILRERGGRIVLADFGLGVFLAAGKAGAEDIPVGGTPLFMAPEQIRGRPPDPRTDLYALGVVLYFLTTGTFPAEAEGMRELFDKIERGALRPLRDSRPDLCDRFVRIVTRALATSPDSRFASAGEMEEALLSVSAAAATTGIIGSPSAPVATAPGEAPRRGGIEFALGFGKWKLRLAVSLCALLIVSSLAWIGLRTGREGGPMLALREEPPNPSPSAGVLDGLDRESSRFGEPGVALERAQGESRPGSRGAPEATAPMASPAPSTDAPAASKVAALAIPSPACRGSIVRLLGDSPAGGDPITPGSRVATGQGFALVYEADRDVFVYVLAESTDGRKELLFPMRGGRQRNPLSARIRHRLPGASPTAGGSSEAQLRSWAIRASGPRVTLVVVSTAKPLREVERLAEVDASAAPAAEEASSAEGSPYPRVDGSALESLLDRVGLEPEALRKAMGGEALLGGLLAGRHVAAREDPARTETEVLTIPLELVPDDAARGR